MNTQADSRISYFGYGSLVNLDTLRTPYISAHRARVTGWERVWLSRPKIEGSFAPYEGLAFLSVRPAKNTAIDGLLITDHVSSLAALDEREALYSRTRINFETLMFPDGERVEADHFLYVADAAPAAPNARILRSYLDAVMQGYLHHFGEQGLQDFIATTANFDLEIQEDRDAPVYPRAVRLTVKQSELFTALI